MPTTRLACSCLLIAVASCHLDERQRSAPLSVRNQHPAQLTALHLGARPAHPTPAGGVDIELAVDWTSLWLRPGGGRDRIVLDGELFRQEPRLRVGAGRGIDIEIALPLMLATGGVLDGFIEAWHDAFGLPQNERDRFPRNRFDVRAERRDASGSLRTAYRLDHGSTALGDLPISLNWFVVDDAAAGFSLGLRGGVELPTGSESRGYGNGEIDYALGLVGGWESERLAAFVWASHAWVGDPARARAAGIGYSNKTSAGLGVDLAVADRLSVLVQTEWEQSVLGRLVEERANIDQALLWIGGRYRVDDRTSLEVAVGEDLVRDVSPDVTFHLGVRIRL